VYSYVAQGGAFGSGPNGSALHGRYTGLLYKRASTEAGADWQFQVLYVPHRLYLFRREGMVGMLTNALYEFLSDRKWGAGRVTLQPRPPVDEQTSTSDATSLTNR
jgi:hypothetical protein